MTVDALTAMKVAAGELDDRPFGARPPARPAGLVVTAPMRRWRPPPPPWSPRYVPGLDPDELEDLESRPAKPKRRLTAGRALVAELKGYR